MKTIIYLIVGNYDYSNWNVEGFFDKSLAERTAAELDRADIVREIAEKIADARSKIWEGENPYLGESDDEEAKDRHWLVGEEAGRQFYLEETLQLKDITDFSEYDYDRNCVKRNFVSEMQMDLTGFNGGACINDK